MVTTVVIVLLVMKIVIGSWWVPEVDNESQLLSGIPCR